MLQRTVVCRVSLFVAMSIGLAHHVAVVLPSPLTSADVCYNDNRWRMFRCSASPEGACDWLSSAFAVQIAALAAELGYAPPAQVDIPGLGRTVNLQRLVTFTSTRFADALQLQDAAGANTNIASSGGLGSAARKRARDANSGAPAEGPALVQSSHGVPSGTAAETGCSVEAMNMVFDIVSGSAPPKLSANQLIDLAQAMQFCLARPLWTPEAMPLYLLPWIQGAPLEQVRNHLVDITC